MRGGRTGVRVIGIVGRMCKSVVDGGGEWSTDWRAGTGLRLCLKVVCREESGGVGREVILVHESLSYSCVGVVTVKKSCWTLGVVFIRSFVVADSWDQRQGLKSSFKIESRRYIRGVCGPGLPRTKSSLYLDDGDLGPCVSSKNDDPSLCAMTATATAHRNSQQQQRRRVLLSL